MKIALVIDQFDDSNNGTSVSARRFVENLRTYGHEVKVVSTGQIAVDKFVVKTRYIPIASRVAKKQGSVFGKPEKKVLKQAFKGADIVHFMQAFALCKKGERIARKMGIPTIGAFHMQPENVTFNIGLGKWEFLNHYLYRRLRTGFYKRFTDIHCPTQFIADQLKEHGYKATLHVISNGVDESFVPIKEIKSKDKPFKILMIGRYAPEKRQDLILNAIHHSQYKDRIELVLAGHGPREQALKKLAQKLGIKTQFGFYPKAELIQLINSCHLYVHCSDVEIEAIACIEAFSCGVVPIISNSDKSATKQFALTEKSLFNAGDALDLSKKIDYFIEHPNELETLAPLYIEQGKQYSVKRSVESITKVYEQVIDNYEEQKVNDKRLRSTKTRYFIPQSLLFRFYSWCFYYLLAVPILFLVNTIVFGYRVHGRKHLRALEGGGITVSNHIHPLDCSMVALSLFPRKPFFTTLESNLETPIIKHLVRGLGGVPIPKSKTDMNQFIREIEEQIKQGRIIHFYPEASLMPYYPKIRTFKNGAFRLASNMNVPIVPIVFTYKKPNPFLYPFKKKPCLHVHISKPIYTDSSQQMNFKELKQTTVNLMETVFTQQ